MYPVVGKEFAPLYPSFNKIGIPIEWRRRHILVTGIHDFSEDRLTPGQWLERPLLRRGSTLIEGQDLELPGHQVEMYLEACKGFDLPNFRMGLFFPDDSLVDWIGHEYEPTRWARASLYEELQRWNRWVKANPKSEMKLGIYRGEVAA